MIKLFTYNKKVTLAIVSAAFLLLFGACKKNGDDPPAEFKESVTAIAIDKNNTKWIGTTMGLYQYKSDKYTKVEAIGDAGVSMVYYERNLNLLWVGTSKGIFKFVLAGGDITSSENVPTENFNSENIRALFIDGSYKRWFGTDLGITLNYGDTWKRDSFSVNGLNDISRIDIEGWRVNSIAEFEGDYFFATTGKILFRATGFDEKIDAFTGATQWAPPYNGENLTSNMNAVYVDTRGYQWMGGEHGIQVHIGHEPKNPDSFILFNSELADSIINVITEAPDGKIWVGTPKGISVCDWEAETWTMITDSLPDVFVSAIAFDKLDNTAWVGTKKGIVNIK